MSLTARGDAFRKNVNCKRQTQRQGQSHVIFGALQFAVIPKKPVAKSLLLILCTPSRHQI